MTKSRYPWRPQEMSEKQFCRFKDFIYSEMGIKISTAKKTMLQARLQKRLRNLGLKSYDEYCDYLFSLKGLEIELPHLVDVVTTNTTNFFRESKHFDYLTQHVLPEWHKRIGGRRELNIWSAGCSSGEEPYTLGIVLNEFLEKNLNFIFSILATDISSEILQKARRAVYLEDKLDQVPLNLKRKYFLRSKDRSKKLVRIVPELRRHVNFRSLNFMEPFNFREQMDVIFCRNVMIYFDRPTQETLLNRFCDHLDSGGHLFIGHSESLAGLSLPLKQIFPTVYQRI